MQINRDNLKWARRMALILVVVALAEGLVAFFARKPLPLAAVIPAAIPLFVAVFIIVPMKLDGKLGNDKPAPPRL